MAAEPTNYRGLKDLPYQPHILAAAVVQRTAETRLLSQRGLHYLGSHTRELEKQSSHQKKEKGRCGLGTVESLLCILSFVSLCSHSCACIIIFFLLLTVQAKID